MSHVSQVHVECQAGYTFIVEARFPSGDIFNLGHTSSGQTTDTTFETAEKKGETVRFLLLGTANASNTARAR